MVASKKSPWRYYCVHVDREGTDLYRMDRMHVHEPLGTADTEAAIADLVTVFLERFPNAVTGALHDAGWSVGR